MDVDARVAILKIQIEIASNRVLLLQHGTRKERRQVNEAKRRLEELYKAKRILESIRDD